MQQGFHHKMQLMNLCLARLNHILFLWLTKIKTPNMLKNHSLLNLILPSIKKNIANRYKIYITIQQRLIISTAPTKHIFTTFKFRFRSVSFMKMVFRYSKVTMFFVMVTPSGKLSRNCAYLENSTGKLGKQPIKNV